MSWAPASCLDAIATPKDDDIGEAEAHQKGLDLALGAVVLIRICEGVMGIQKNPVVLEVVEGIEWIR